MTPLKAIKAKCLDCCAYQKEEVKLCTCTDCPLYPFRFGKDPFRKARTMSEEQRLAASKRLKQMWENKKANEISH